MTRRALFHRGCVPRQGCAPRTRDVPLDAGRRPGHPRDRSPPSPPRILGPLAPSALRGGGSTRAVRPQRLQRGLLDECQAARQGALEAGPWGQLRKPRRNRGVARVSRRSPRCSIVIPSVSPSSARAPPGSRPGTSCSPRASQFHDLRSDRCRRRNVAHPHLPGARLRRVGAFVHVLVSAQPGLDARASSSNPRSRHISNVRAGLRARVPHPLEHADREGGYAIEGDGTWLSASDPGESFEHDVVINAMGNQHTPLYPDVPGMEGFAGESFHATRWNHDVELAGKRVAVVGIGRERRADRARAREDRWPPDGAAADARTGSCRVGGSRTRSRGGQWFRRLPALIRMTQRFQRFLMGFVHPP